MTSNREAPSPDDTLEDAWDDITEPGRRRAGARIVVVEDDGDMRELVTARLVAEGYDVQNAISGVELMSVLASIAVERWPLDGVDLLVLDNRMPGMTGLEAVRRLREAHWETPAILMTAFPELAVKVEAARLGVPVLPKPFPLELLTNTILLSLLPKSERVGRVAH